MKSRLYLISLLGSLAIVLSLVVFRSALQTPSPAVTPQKPRRAPGDTASPSASMRSIGSPPASAQTRLVANYGKLPLSFEANRGQADSQVKFLSRGRGYSLFLTGDEAVLWLRNRGQRARVKGQRLRREHRWSLIADGLQEAPRGGIETKDQAQGTNDVLQMKLVGANPNARVTGSEELPGKVNYFIGNDPKKWHTQVPTFAKVRYENVYPGADLVYYGNQGGQLEYDFVVAAGADPSNITLAVEAGLPLHERGGVKPPLRIDANGDLVVKTKTGEMHFKKPIVYQEQESGARSQESGAKPSTMDKGPRATDAFNRQSAIGNRQYLEGRYVLTTDNHVHFEVHDYDISRTLVIDPVLVYSTYLGGSGINTALNIAGEPSSIAVDLSGNVYVTGATRSTDFPTVNPFQATCGSCTPGSGSDAFVTKFNAAGNALVYSTYLGGSDFDWGGGIAVDSSGSAYVTGATNSPDFPTVNPFQAHCAGFCPFKGNVNAFVAKLNAAGNALLYSTYLGGTFVDAGEAIAVDSSGSAYVAGQATSNDFPTQNPFQLKYGGGPSDAFLSKFDATGSTLVYSTYLGGIEYDIGYGIAVDSSDNAYVTGFTTSSDFPTANPLQSTCGGGSCTFSDAFVTKFDATGKHLAYSTFLGGSLDEFGAGIAVDSSGNAYVTGETGSTDFPTMNPLQAANAGGRDAFVTKLNAAGSALVYSTYFGGGSQDRANGIAVDSSGNAYITGSTFSNDLPTLNPVQATCGTCSAGLTTAFVTQLNAAGSALVYSTFLGGSDQENGGGIAVDSSGNAYVTGATFSGDFPTLHAFQPSGGLHPEDTFVAKISPADAAAVSLAPAAVNFPDQFIKITSSPQTIALHDMGSAELTISSISITGTNAADFSLSSNPCGPSLSGGGACDLEVTFTPTILGTETAAVTVTDSASGSPHMATLTGKGINPPVVSLSPTSLAFANQIVGTTSASETATIINTGGSQLSGITFAITGTDPNDFSEADTCSGGTLAVGASCTATITFTPAALGTRTATHTIDDNAPTSPQTAPLSGTGVSGAVVSLSSASINFGSVAVGTASSPQTLTVANSGSANLTVSTASIAGTNASDFTKSSDSCAGANVAPNGTCSVAVVFKASLVGNESATLNISDNATGSPQMVALVGAGEDFGVAVATGSFSSATVKAGQSATYKITVTPLGGFNQTVSLSCAGSPMLATCTPSPASVTLDGTNSQNVTIAVSTTAPTVAGPRWPEAPGPWPPVRDLAPLLWLMALLIVALGPLGVHAAGGGERRPPVPPRAGSDRRYRAARRAPVHLALAAALLACLLAACGGVAHRPGTPTGAYTLTLTATDAQASPNLSHNVTLSLTVN